MSEHEGGPAFPWNEPGYGCGTGMSLRDWYAGQAIIALAAEATAVSVSIEDAAAAMAKASYLISDAMLAERSK